MTRFTVLAAFALALGGTACSDAGDAGSGAPRVVDPQDGAPGGETEAGRLGAEADAFTAADEGGEEPTEAARIPLCLRLNDPNRPVKIYELSQDMVRGYLTLVATDCMMHGLFTARTLVDWSNQLYLFNVDLWGCRDGGASEVHAWDAAAGSGFALIPSQVTELTSTDAAVLIDDYLKAATRVLRLSPPEVTHMRQDLVQLSMAAITRQSDERLFSECDAGAVDTEAGGGGGSDSASADAWDGGDGSS